MAFGDKAIERKQLEPRVELVRVINKGGVPYSAIEVDGVEVLSAPTKDEKGLLKCFEISREELLK